MKLNPIITSLMEIDMYKLSMGQCIYHQFSGYKTTWTFHCRNKDVFFTTEMVNEIREQLQAYCALRFTEEELQYIDSIRWIKGSYVDFLRLWQPRYEDFTISTDAPCGLAIEARGSWLCSSMYEIPILAIINEVYFRMQYDYDRKKAIPGCENQVSPILCRTPCLIGNYPSRRTFLISEFGSVSSKDPFQNLANILPTERQLDIVCYYTRNTHHIIFVF